VQNRYNLQVHSWPHLDMPVPTTMHEACAGCLSMAVSPEYYCQVSSMSALHAMGMMQIEQNQIEPLLQI
jgi:hypothetical protein